MLIARWTIDSEGRLAVTWVNLDKAEQRKAA